MNAKKSAHVRPPIPNQPALPKLCLLGLAAGIAVTLVHAATYTEDFTSTPMRGYTYGSAVVEDEVLKLTINANDQTGSFIVDELDPGRKVASFTVSFRLRIGGGTATPADGFSFNFANDLPDAAFGEDGAGTGLSVCFDTYDNGGGEAPAVDVRYGGVNLFTRKYGSLRTGANYAAVRIHVDENGMLDLVYRASVLVTNVQCMKPMSGGRFGFGARTGGLNDNHWMDDLSIQTVLLTTPAVRSASPTGPNVFGDAVVRIELEDWDTQVDPASVRLEFNGASVTPQLDKVDVVTTVTYDPPGLLPPGSTNTYKISFADLSPLPVTKSEQFSFVVEKYPAIPAKFALPLSAVNQDAPGFNVRVVQARVDALLSTSIARAEAQLAGTLIDFATGQPFANEADLTLAGADGYFVDEDVINYDEAQTGRGNFIFDELIPGIPGTTAHADNFAAEILTYLELAPGYYKFGVNSDDGFQLKVGLPVRDPMESLVLGAFDGPRGASDSLFSFTVEKAGVYPFRLVWFEGGLEANVEFFSITGDGTMVLINDRSDAAAVNAWRERVAASPAPPYLLSVTPAPGKTSVSLKPNVKIVVKDDQSKVATGTVKLYLNGNQVAPQVSKSADLTTITYAHPTALPELSANTLKLSFADNATPAFAQSHEWQFVTGVPSVPGGSFASDFTSRPVRVLLYGNAAVTQGALQLTTAANTLVGTFIIQDFNINNVVTSFTATFKALVGGGTIPPADGFGFCFAPDLPNANFAMGEEGQGSGLSVCFDTYDNGNAEAPAIDVKYGGVTLASTRTDIIETGEAFVDVVIKVDEEGYLDLLYNGIQVYQHLACYQPTAGRFALSARTGGLNDNHWFDDLHITTTIAAPTPVQIKLSSITVAGGNLTVTWNGGPGIKLQKTPTLAIPNWQDVPGSLGNSTVTEALSGTAAFYRALKP
jgi:hypothetical protein